MYFIFQFLYVFHVFYKEIQIIVTNQFTIWIILFSL